MIQYDSATWEKSWGGIFHFRSNASHNLGFYFTLIRDKLFLSCVRRSTVPPAWKENCYEHWFDSPMALRPFLMLQGRTIFVQPEHPGYEYFTYCPVFVTLELAAKPLGS